MPNGKGHDEGFQLHFGLLMLVVLAVCIWLFGWWAMGVAAALAVLIALGTWIHDRIRLPAPIENYSLEELREIYGPGDPDEDGVEIPGDGEPCPKCGKPVFVVTYGSTKNDEIREWVRRSPAWSENPVAVGGWMPPGVWCPDGCTAVQSTPAVDRGPNDYDTID